MSSTSFLAPARAALVLSLGLAFGCAEVAGPLGDGTDPAGPGSASSETRIYLTGGSGSSAQGALAPLFSVAGGGPLTLAQIHDFAVEIDEVQAKPEEGPWETVWSQGEEEDPLQITLEVLQSGEVELLASAEGLPAGSYEHVRFAVSDAWIAFAEAVTVGQNTYEAYTDVESYPMKVPSDELKVPTAHFDVSEEGGGTVVIVFDAGESAAKIIATGSGMILMRPVLTEADEEEEAEVESEEEGSEEEGSGEEESGGDTSGGSS